MRYRCTNKELASIHRAIEAQDYLFRYYLKLALLGGAFALLFEYMLFDVWSFLWTSLLVVLMFAYPAWYAYGKWLLKKDLKSQEKQQKKVYILKKRKHYYSRILPSYWIYTDKGRYCVSEEQYRLLNIEEEYTLFLSTYYNLLLNWEK